MYYTTANTYNKTEVNNFLDGKLDASAYTPCDLTNYYTKNEVNSAITQSTSGLQQTLIAGDNITISGNVISATGGGSGTTYTAGHAIDITNNVISFGLPMSAGTGTGAIIVDDPNNVASGDYSVAYGSNTSALTEFSFVTGYNNKAVGLRAYVEGANNSASGNVSHVQGELNESNNFTEAANGLLNISTKNPTIEFGNSGATLFTIGNGRYDQNNPSNNVRHNAVEVKQNGDIYIANTCQSGNWYELPMMKLQDYLCSIPKFECITEQQWESISGNPDSNTVYFVH